MGYTLIISEKPNAAKKIAEALADNKVDTVKKNTVSYFRITRGGKNIVVVPAVGHLFVLQEKEKASRWTYPIFSIQWVPSHTIKGNAWSKKYFDNIKSLVKGADDFISATDFDIEGSTIAFNILRYICNVKNGKRMRFSTLTEQDIVDAYENASKKLDFPQIDAGLTRAYVDWYFGINLSRALTLALEHTGGYWVLSIGRVQGPTLQLIDKREREINAFKPKPYWEIELDGKIEDRAVIAAHEKDKFWKKPEADAAMSKCKGKNGTVYSVERKEQNQYPPFPFDLTTLQRESYKLFGYSPTQTLSIAQSLYEHAVISYPRTSSQKLPAKIGFKTILNKLWKQKPYAKFCEQLMARKTLKPNEGKKTDSAHPAIYPTGHVIKMNNYQRKLYDLIVRRFLAVFADPAIREHMRVVIDVNKEKFVTHGVKTIKANWMEFYGPHAKFKEQILPDIIKGEAVSVKKLSMFDKKTEPPNRYSQASVLKVMEDNGLGTKATRSQILQTLYDRSYIKERSIEVTEIGQSVVKSLEKYSPEIVSPRLTRQLEDDMEKIEAGKEKKDEVIDRTEKELKKILKEFKEHEKNIGEGILDAVREYEKEIHDVGPCPKCRKEGRKKGELMIIRSKRTGKRFVGCNSYPDCKNSFPLPQHGYVEVSSDPCPMSKLPKSACGFNLIQVKSKGKRPWRFCIAHGFENKIRQAMKGGDSKTKSQAKKSTTKAKPKTVKKKTK
jgi:DNA topoisomerase-1